MSEQTSAPPESSRQVDHNPEKWPNDNPFSPTQFVNDLSRAGPWGYRAPKLSREELFGEIPAAAISRCTLTTILQVIPNRTIRFCGYRLNPRLLVRT